MAPSIAKQRDGQRPVHFANAAAVPALTMNRRVAKLVPESVLPHGMLRVQLHGDQAGQPWAPVAARRMLARAGKRADLGVVRPHAFRHSFTSAVLDASGGNLVVARDAGGWASATMVDEVYRHVDLHDPVFDAALCTVWGDDR